VGELLTLAEVASRFNVGTSTVYDWKNRHGLRPVDPEARPLRFDLDDLVERLPSRSTRKAASAANGRKPKRQRSSGLTRFALDLYDLAHITGRGDVTQDDWLRVCRGRFREWPPELKNQHRTYERWKQRLRRMRVPFHLVNVYGEPYQRGDQSHECASLRFDWPMVLRWVARVLD
jgi:hypothetical protein